MKPVLIWPQKRALSQILTGQVTLKSKFVKNLPKALQNKIKEQGIRNSTLTTVAPTGSGAIVARVTSGVEPIFATSTKKS